ncbi:hypothetical protein [Nonomuraea monospora]|uniref:hypothetical protein n=1 Tax=Nonomuraea monospora TaxID=568818 RepID=UPI0031DA79F7
MSSRGLAQHRDVGDDGHVRVALAMPGETFRERQQLPAFVLRTDRRPHVRS